jgi:hypothetical protein
MRVDVSRLRATRPAQMRDAVKSILAEAERNNDPVYLSDIVTHEGTAGTGCEILMEELRSVRQNSKPKYRIQVLCDEWGNKPKEGDIVRRQFKNPLTVDGKLLTAKQLNGEIRMGIMDQERYYYNEYTVDEKGCILCDANDAEWFLYMYGLHSFSNYPLNQYEELSPGPAKNKATGGMQHVHYWRYKEMTAEQYEALEPLKAEPEAPAEQTPAQKRAATMAAKKAEAEGNN